MKNIIITVLVIIVLFSLSSCDGFSTIVDVDLPESEKKLAIHLDLLSGTRDTSYFNITKVIAENLTEDKGEIDKNNVTISILNETDGTSLAVTSRNFYTNTNLFAIKNIDFKPGDKYALSVNYPGFNSLSATATVLSSPPEIDKYTFEKVKQGGFDEDEVTKMTLKFKDLPGSNFYRVRVLLKEVTIAFTATGDTVSIETTEPYLFNRGYSEDPSIYGAETGFLISDESFDGKTKELIINIEKEYNTRYQYNGGIEASRIKKGEGFFYFEQISEERYNFEKSYDTFYQNDGNPFGTPTKVFSNINEGYGIFSISTGKEYQIAF